MGDEYFNSYRFDRNIDFAHGHSEHLKSKLLDSIKRFTSHTNFSDLDEELTSTFKKLSHNNLFEIVGELQYFDFSYNSIGEREFAGTFNNFLNSFSGWGRDTNESFTPPKIARFISSLVEVAPNQNFCDPFAGNGGLASEILKGHSGYGCVFQDINPVSVILGRMNLILHGAKEVNFHIGNTIDLYSSHLNDRKFDYVVTHPPFGVRYRHADFYQLPNHFLPANSRGENVHIQLAVHLLNDFGRAIVLIPDGFLFTNDRGSKEIKSWLLHNDWVEAVYSLPIGSFKPYSAANTSLIVINKNKSPQHARQVLFKEVSESELELSQVRNYDMGTLFEPFEVYDNSRGNRAIVVNLNEVFENDLLLNVNRYLDKIELGPEYQSINTVLRNHSIGVGVPKKYLDSREGIPYITIKDLSTSDEDFLLPQESITTFINKMSIIKPNYVVHGGAILIAKVGTKLKPTLFVGNSAAFSSNIIALYPNEDLVISEYLIAQFNQPYFRQQLNQIRGGAVQVFVRLEDFLKLKIKVPTLESQEKELLQIFRQREYSIKSLKGEREQDEKSAQRVLFSAIKHEFSNLHVVLSGGITSIKHYLDGKAKSGSIDWADKIVNLPDSRTIQQLIVQQESVLEEMGSLFDDVQALLALDRSQLRKERVVLRSFIQDHVDLMKGQLRNVEVTVGLTEKSRKDRLVVNIDKPLFAKVIKNFLTNSIKHGFAEAPFDQRLIAFDVCVSEDELWVELTMINNGNKFPDGFTFEDFISFGVKSGNNKGAGIGGFLINEVVKFHDGTFEELKFPEGATLYIATHSISSSKEANPVLSKAFIPGVGFKIRLPYND